MPVREDGSRAEAWQEACAAVRSHRSMKNPAQVRAHRSEEGPLMRFRHSVLGGHERVAKWRPRLPLQVGVSLALLIGIVVLPTPSADPLDPVAAATVPIGGPPPPGSGTVTGS